MYQIYSRTEYIQIDHAVPIFEAEAAGAWIDDNLVTSFIDDNSETTWTDDLS